jgi:RNase P subunit RPR2
MELSYTTKNGKITVKFEAKEQKDMFAQIAEFQEVFEEVACGKCKSENLKFVVRKDDEENEYYELRCLDCGAKLEFGVNKKGGTIYPKRKDKEGKYLPDKGWVKWDSKLQKNV